MHPDILLQSFSPTAGVGAAVEAVGRYFVVACLVLAAGALLGIVVERWTARSERRRWWL